MFQNQNVTEPASSTYHAKLSRVKTNKENASQTLVSQSTLPPPFCSCTWLGAKRSHGFLRFIYANKTFSFGSLLPDNKAHRRVIYNRRDVERRRQQQRKLFTRPRNFPFPAHPRQVIVTLLRVVTQHFRARDKCVLGTVAQTSS